MYLNIATNYLQIPKLLKQMPTDDLDIKLLNLLQTNGRIKRNELAEMVGLSLPAVSDRLNKLEEKGIIEKYSTVINRKKLGYDIMTFIMVVSDSSKQYKGLTTKAEKHPAILECHAILGEGSHLLKAIAKDTADLEKLLSEIQTWPGVHATNTLFVLSTNKETTEIKLTS